jgi:glycosyltransferase involved in cell wall biosynthesis
LGIRIINERGIMKKISACIMVKNEEHCLERCLKSIKDYVDEIIIVDTGSTDDTVKIAREYTDKIYFHEWENDFSKHRNQTIDYATGDWILIIDADEEFKTFITPEMLKTILFEKVEEKMNSAAITMEDKQKGKIVMRCNSARFFRKDKVRYKGRVHNQPIIDGPSVILKDITVFHYGYDLPQDKMQEKFKRTESLLFKQYENNENPHAEFYLCQLYGQHKKHIESREWGEKYLAKRDTIGEHFNETIYFTMTKNYMDTDDMDKAWGVIAEFLKVDKPDPDMGLAISDFGAKTNRFDIMSVGCRKYLKSVQHYEENPVKMGSKFYFSIREDVKSLILYRLCMVCFQEGIEAWKILKSDLNKLDVRIFEELKRNFSNLGLSFLLEEHNQNDYELPLLKAI